VDLPAVEDSTAAVAGASMVVAVVGSMVAAAVTDKA
jgi:hypothetical protein